jgi:hypothetical protein
MAAPALTAKAEDRLEGDGAMLLRPSPPLPHPQAPDIPAVVDREKHRPSAVETRHEQEEERTQQYIDRSPLPPADAQVFGGGATTAAALDVSVLFMGWNGVEQNADDSYNSPTLSLGRFFEKSSVFLDWILP